MVISESLLVGNMMLQCADFEKNVNEGNLKHLQGFEGFKT